MPSLSVRFERKVDRTGPHHLWIGSCDSAGRGQFRVDGQLTTAPRVAWELANGPVPESAEAVLAGHELQGIFVAGAATIRQHSAYYACVANRDRQSDQINNGIGSSYGLGLVKSGLDMNDVGTVISMVEARVADYARSMEGLDFGGVMAAAEDNSSFS